MFSAERDMDAWMKSHFAFCTDSQLSTPEVGIHRNKTLCVETMRVKCCRHHGRKNCISVSLEMLTGLGVEARNAAYVRPSGKGDAASSTAATCRLRWNKISASLLHRTFTPLTNRSIMLLRFERCTSAWERRASSCGSLQRTDLSARTSAYYKIAASMSSASNG